MLSLFVLSGVLLLIPACTNTNSNTTTTPNGITPANTYSFTIVGVDTNGVVSSNTGSTTSAGPTVSLTVTAPKTQSAIGRRFPAPGTTNQFPVTTI